MFKKKQDKKKQLNPSTSKQPTLREIEEMFVDNDYPLKGKKPYKKI